jgi:DNA primase
MSTDQDILKVARELLTGVKPHGTELSAICPFHVKPDGSPERSPSFSMSIESGMFFCHSCHTSGNLRTFLKLMGVSALLIEHAYGELLELAARGIKLKPQHNPLKPKAYDESPIKEALLGLFSIHSVDGFLPSFSPPTLRYFDIGWDGWHGRVTFPIRDLAGKLTAISGRAVYPEQFPRYKVYDKEYAAWDMPSRVGWLKGNVLWNSHNVLPMAIEKNPGEGEVIVVEGFKALMWVWQCGFKNVVALLGSHMTIEQRWILEHFNSRVLLFLDNNQAGRHGQQTAASELSKALDVRIIEYPPRLKDITEAQPDMLTAEEMVQQVTTATPYIKWYLNRRNHNGIGK